MPNLEINSVAPNSIYGRWYQVEIDGHKHQGTADDIMRIIWEGREEGPYEELPPNTED